MTSWKACGVKERVQLRKQGGGDALRSSADSLQRFQGKISPFETASESLFSTQCDFNSPQQLVPVSVDILLSCFSVHHTWLVDK